MEKEPKNNRDRETVNAAESFNYTNESNLDPRNNEFFVYHFEENKNKAGFEDNKKETGKEVNTDIDKATEIKTEDFSKVTKISKVATATVQTVVVTTTTTVVAVVAGGAAVAELSYIEPKFHEFSVVETVGNSVSYTLLLGDDLEVIQNEEDQQTRNVVIELKLDSYDKVVEATKIDKYGTVTGTFENLNYSCDYTITAYEYSFMDVAGWIPHQLDSKKFTTEPERNYGLVFERVIDEEQDPHFFVTLSYNDPNSYYSNFSLEFFLFSGEEESSIGSANLVTPYTDKQEVIMPSDFRDEITYRVKVNCLSTDPRDGYQEDENGRGNPVPITLFSKEIEFASIEQETLPVAKRDVEFDRVIDGYGQEHYYVTLTCDDEHNYYSNFAVETVSIDDGTVVSSNNLSEPYTDRQEIIMPVEFVGENTYRIDVKCLSTNPKHQPQGKYAPEGGSDGVAITLFSKEIAFADIPEEVEEPIETDYRSLTFRGEINSYDETLYYARHHKR